MKPSPDLFDKVVEPVYLRRLRDKLKDQKTVAAAVGMSPSHIGKCLAGTVPTSLTLELAAKSVYTERFGGDQTFLVKADAHTAGRITELFRLADIKAVIVNVTQGA